jgi:WD40 repeat protein
MAFSPDGRTLATTNISIPGGEEGGAVQLWDVHDRHTPTRTAIVPNDYGIAIAFSPDGHTLATTTASAGTSALGGVGGTVRLWDVTDRHAPTRIFTAHDDQYVIDVVFSPDGHTLATTTSGNVGGTVQLWDVTDRHAPTRIFTAHDDQYGTAVAFSSDGHTLAHTTGIGGGTVQLWDVANRQAPTRIFTVQDNEAFAAAFAPDGRTVAATTGFRSTDGTVQLWDIEWAVSLSGQLHNWACSAAGSELRPDEWDRYVSGMAHQPSCP